MSAIQKAFRMKMRSERRIRFGYLDASFYVAQGWRPLPRTLVRTSFKSFKDNAKANEEPLPFGQSYWDYLPDLVQNKIMKMVHKSLLEEVHFELLGKSYCPNCGNYFGNPFEMVIHWSDLCNRKYWWDSNRDDACDCTPHCECVWDWDDWSECLRCECCGSER